MDEKNEFNKKEVREKFNIRANSKKDKEYTVGQSMKLLEFLFTKYPTQSRNNVKSLLSQKKVLVDGACISQFDYLLYKGQVVTVKSSSTIVKGRKEASKVMPKLLDIIYEDEDLIVFNKPSGLLTIASDSEKELTVYRLMMDHVRQSDKKNRVFIAHRLDRDTSGIMMIAKSQLVQELLQEDWNATVLKRGYIAVVEGEVKLTSGRVHSWLKETKTHMVYSSDKKGDGQEAITDYTLEKGTDRYSLVQLFLSTGRKNQIRVHMADLGHSVVGDDKYGARSNPLNRLGLHANMLEFIHPTTKKVMSFKTETPKKFLTLFGQSK